MGSDCEEDGGGSGSRSHGPAGTIRHECAAIAGLANSSGARALVL